jgi:hypothetical protein
MAEIKLKTVKRKTSVSRLAIRRAIAEVHSSRAPIVKKTVKKAAKKKAARSVKK